MKIKKILVGVVFVQVGLSLGTSTALAQEIVQYVHTDALGSPVAISDATGAIIERTLYEPYGAVVGDAKGDRPGFTGHVSDSKTGLTYMQQRYYDTELGLFVSSDPVSPVGDVFRHYNRYRYANGNPAGNIDPDGRRACGQSTTCRLMQGENGNVMAVRNPGAEEKERDPAKADAIAGKVASEATARTDGVRNKEHKNARIAARIWYDRVMPVAIKYNAEIAVRFFQGYGGGAVFGNSVSDGYINSIGYQTIADSVSNVSAVSPVIGWAHTHPGMRTFSPQDLSYTFNVAGQVNKGRSTPIEVLGFVGLRDGSMRVWSSEKRVDEVLND